MTYVCINPTRMILFIAVCTGQFPWQYKERVRSLTDKTLVPTQKQVMGVCLRVCLVHRSKKSQCKTVTVKINAREQTTVATNASGWSQDAATYCPQRESEEGDKQRRPVPAGDAVNQQTAVI